MADLAKIKSNVAKMISMNAPESDIDGYIASEGVTVDDVRNFGKDYTLGRLGSIDRGATFGLGRKLGSFINAVGAYPVDRAAELMGKENTPGFWDRYHEIADPTMEAINEYQTDKPVEAFLLETGAGLVNPANKVGANYIGNGATTAAKIGRSSLVGSGVGGVAGAMNTEHSEDLPENTIYGTAVGAALGSALPIAGSAIGKTYNRGKALFSPEKSVAGKETGLGNIVKDNDSVRILKRGIMAGDDVATQVSEQAPAVMDALNKEMADIVDNTVGRKLDFNQAIENQKERLGKFVKNNENVELYSTKAKPKTGNKPSLKQFTQGLNEYQEQALNTALNEGKKHSTAAKGTLGATHKAQEVLNDMIDASYDTKNPFKPRPTTETRDLEIVKQRLNQILEPSGVKEYDTSFSKAKALQSAFDKGYSFKPSDIKFSSLGLKTLREKRSFLQGYLRKIEENVLSDGGTNLADAVRKTENVLKEVLPQKKVDKILSDANRINREFGRLKKLSQLADNTIDKPLAVDRPASERWEGLGALLGSLKDKASAKMWTNSNRRRALALLNGVKESQRQNIIESRLRQLATMLSLPVTATVSRQQDRK
jgi:hypothetical protein